MIQFTNPIFLWSLLGLSIPIGIHLLSRKEGQLLRLGSLRHVQETSTQQFKGIRLNEILLMILRCSLVVVFSLLLSGLSWNFLGTRRWVLVERGLENQSRLIPVLDSLRKQGYEAHFLSNGFPLLGGSPSTTSAVNYRDLIEQLKTKNISEAIIFSQNKVNDFKGLRSPLPSNVRWISQPSDPLDYTLQAIQITPDSIAVRRGHTQFNETNFASNTVKLSGNLESVPPEKITVLLASDEKYDYDKLIVKAALDAIDKSLPVEIILKEATANPSVIFSTDWCIWLSDKEIPQPSLSKIINLNPQLSDDLILRTGPNQWAFTKRVSEEVALKENLTLALANLIEPINPKIQETAISNDRRMLPDSLAWSPAPMNSSPVGAGIPLESANPYLLLLLFVLLFIERSIAYKRNQ